MIMPDISGGEVYDKIKRQNSKIKTLLSSGYSMDGQAAEILERGCDAFIQKPFNMKELSIKMREVLDRK
jgi:CheY-like chemotaxis protein